MTISFSEKENPWVGNENSIWLATTLELCRNVDKFHFPIKLNAERKAHIIQLIHKTLSQSDIFSGLSLLLATEISPMDRQFLFEHFLIFGHPPQPHPGEAFVIDSSGQILFVLNIKDHVQLYALSTSQDLERSWTLLTKIEDALQKTIQFAFSEEFGYLTSDPMHTGTGLIVSAFMHVPALILEEKLASFLDEERQEAVFALNLYGNSEDFLGDILVLKNRYTLGVTEEIIISNIHKAALRLLAEENSARNELKKKKPEDAEDKISRAVGILQNSFSIGTSEALKALSLVKLGIELGWIKGIDLATINRLFFECRRAHLARRIGPQFSLEHAHAIRAEFLRQETKSLHFA